MTVQPQEKLVASDSGKSMTHSDLDNVKEVLLWYYHEDSNKDYDDVQDFIWKDMQY
jgi:hypothetical protein